MQARPVDPIESFEFGGQKFEVYNFITTDIGKSDRIEEHFQEPNFYTIDEWFKK